MLLIFNHLKANCEAQWGFLLFFVRESPHAMHAPTRNQQSRKRVLKKRSLFNHLKRAELYAEQLQQTTMQINTYGGRAPIQTPFVS